MHRGGKVVGIKPLCRDIAGWRARGFDLLVERQMPAAPATEGFDMVELWFAGIEACHFGKHFACLVIGVGVGRDIAAGQPPFLVFGVVADKQDLPAELVTTKLAITWVATVSSVMTRCSFWVGAIVDHGWRALI